MGILREDIINATFLTMFKDINNIIYHKQADGESFVYATVVYIPAPEPLADRIQLKTEDLYTARIVQRGTTIPSLDDLPEMKDHVLSRVRNEEGVGHYLTVPLDEIVEVYEPHQVLEEEIEGDFSCDLKKIVDLFISAGIPFQAIGLYGGLLSGMRKFSGNTVKKHTDIDILIKGLDYCDNLKGLSEATLHSQGFSRFEKPLSFYIDHLDFVTNSPLHALAMLRRDNYLGLLLDDTTIHIKLARGHDDPNTYPFNYDGSHDYELVELEGVVESDLEGPTIPAVFRIASDSGTLKVCTMIFRWSGALFKGDKAKVKGKRIKQDIVVLDQDGHYIYTAGEN